MLMIGCLSALDGCGPSYQALYEGDAKFERCYALDENPARSLGEKATCWREWQERHTFGQTRDRVEYASARYRALTRMHEAPTDEAMMQAAPGETPGNHNVRVAPIPTSAFAPPPRLLSDDGGVPPVQNTRVLGDPTLPVIAPATGPASPAPPAPPAAAPGSPGSSGPPGSECGNRCAEAWRSCKDNPDACDKGYRKCMRVCFK